MFHHRHLPGLLNMSLLLFIEWSYFFLFFLVCFSELLDIRRLFKSSLHKKWSFQVRISSVNLTKSTVSSKFGPISHLLKKSLMESKVVLILSLYSRQVLLSQNSNAHKTWIQTTWKVTLLKDVSRHDCSNH